MIVDPDASKFAVGCVVSQIVDGVEQLIGFYSTALRGYRFNWHISRREFFAIYSDIKKYSHYLLRAKFLVRTDHKFLVNLNDETKEILRRWALELEEYEYTIEYRPGLQHNNADGMSCLDINIPEKEVSLFIFDREVIKRSKLKDALESDHLWSIIYNYLVRGTEICPEKEEDRIKKALFKKTKRLVSDLQIIAKEEYRLCVDPERISNIEKLLYFLDKDVIKLITPKILIPDILKEIHEISHFWRENNLQSFKESFYSELLERELQLCAYKCFHCM